MRFLNKLDLLYLNDPRVLLGIMDHFNEFLDVTVRNSKDDCIIFIINPTERVH